MSVSDTVMWYAARERGRELDVALNLRGVTPGGQRGAWERNVSDAQAVTPRDPAVP